MHLPTILHFFLCETSIDALQYCSKSDHKKYGLSLVIKKKKNLMAYKIVS